MPRLVRKVIQGERLIFSGFPRQWIPVFEYFGVHWNRCSAPQEYMPIISEISNEDLSAYCVAAHRNGTLRELVESIVVLDPVLADFIYILDNTNNVRKSQEVKRAVRIPARLTNWQSYGRPEIRKLIMTIDDFQCTDEEQRAIVLPCSRRKP